MATEQEQYRWVDFAVFCEREGIDLDYEEDWAAWWECWTAAIDASQAELIKDAQKTADGVVVVLGKTEIWWNCPYAPNREPVYLGIAFSITIGRSFGPPWVLCMRGNRQRLSECYSTHEACKAAIDAEDVKEN